MVEYLRSTQEALGVNNSQHYKLRKKIKAISELIIVANTCNLSIWEVEPEDENSRSF